VAEQHSGMVWGQAGVEGRLGSSSMTHTSAGAQSNMFGSSAPDLAVVHTVEAHLGAVVLDAHT
jgi:hypothetical protein